MTALDKVAALVDAHVCRDHGRFRAITHQIAASLPARSSDTADRLRKLVDKPQALTPLPSARGLLSSPPELAVLDDMVITMDVRERLDRVVLEYGQREALRLHSLRPVRKLLFTGPPGVGKTMAAGALAQAVGLPMFRVELHGVISSHLGESAAKLAQVFEHVGSMAAVYLFDEFDAIGSDRGGNDGSAAAGEMRRVVSSLLQFMENDRSESLIVAATNLAPKLDSAVFRRFDEVISFDVPTEEAFAKLVCRALERFPVRHLDLDALYAAVGCFKLGHADVCVALDRVLKDHVLRGIPIDTGRIVESLRGRFRIEREGSS